MTTDKEKGGVMQVYDFLNVISAAKWNLTRGYPFCFTSLRAEKEFEIEAILHAIKGQKMKTDKKGREYD